MASKKIGISLSEEALAVAHARVEAGRAESVSGCIDDLLLAQKEAEETKKFLAEWEADLDMTHRDRTRIDKAYGLGRFRKGRKLRKAG